MRTLSATLLAGQQAARIAPLWKVVLTKSGSATQTFEKDRVLDIDHMLKPTDCHATLRLDNTDGTLTALALEGYKAVISYGVNTSGGGEEYSPCAPLWVVGQRLDSLEGRLVCYLDLIGIPNLLAEDRARTPYQPASTDTKTVKDIINDMFDGTMPAFDACPTYTVTFDSEDALIDVYTPKDAFRVYVNGSRMAALRRVLDWTGCVFRFEDDGEIHIQDPTTSITWTRPTGGSGWTNPANAYDADADPPTTYANAAVGSSQVPAYTGGYLELTHAGVSSSLLRVYPRFASSGGTQKLEVQVEYGGEWHMLHSGTFTSEAWLYLSLGSAKTVTGVRIRGWADTATIFYIYDVQLGPPDYIYSLDTGHAFFSEAYRSRLVIPNKVVVETPPDASPAYTGNAADADSYAALGYYITQYEQTHLASDAQGTALATALLSHYQMHAEKGSATVPLNVGAELYDYVAVVDDRQTTFRSGNIGTIHRRVSVGKDGTTWEMTFSFGGWLTARDLMAQLEIHDSGFGSAGQSFSKLSVKNLWAENIHATNMTFGALFNLDDLEENPSSPTYTRVLTTHLDAHGLKVSSDTTFVAGYDPTDKLDKASETLDDIVNEGTTYQRLRATDISAGHIKLTDNVVVDGEWYDEHGVEIDSATGITVYGTAAAFRTRATKDGTDQCYVGADGFIYAGAGAIWLSATGMTIKGDESGGAFFTMIDHADAVRGYVLHRDSDDVFAILAVGADLFLGAGTGKDIVLGDSLIPSVSLTPDLGSAAKLFEYGYIDKLHVPTSIALFGHAEAGQRLKANYNNWAAHGDVVNALVDLGLLDQA